MNERVIHIGLRCSSIFMNGIKVRMERTFSTDLMLETIGSSKIAELSGREVPSPSKSEPRAASCQCFLPARRFWFFVSGDDDCAAGATASCKASTSMIGGPAGSGISSKKRLAGSQ